MIALACLALLACLLVLTVRHALHKNLDQLQHQAAELDAEPAPGGCVTLPQEG